MVLAVVDGDPNVLQWKAGESPFSEGQSHALLHGRYELARNRTTHHFIDEFEPLTALERFDSQEHFAELTRAAGLFLVAAMAFS